MTTSTQRNWWIGGLGRTLPVLVLLGCSRGSQVTGCSVGAQQCAMDRDGDGWGNIDDIVNYYGEKPDTGIECVALILALDPNDDDASVYPDAPEICDGIDNNGEDGVDEANDDLEDRWPDMDGDGFGDGASEPVKTCAEGFVDNDDDLDDDNVYVYPDADEICDGLDNDGDGQVDEAVSFMLTWYRDGDGDGYGDDDVTKQACSQPEGYIGLGGDCNDDDAANHQCWYLDGDGDGYGTGSEADACICDSMDDNADVLVGGDCDDDDPAISPGEEEACDDSTDGNCDGHDDPVWYPDGDGDGWGDAAGAVVQCDDPGGYLSAGGDCDDDDPAVNPGAQEDCHNGVDDDCDGLVDLADLDDFTWYRDEDGDGVGVFSSNPVQACDIPEGYGRGGDDCNDGDITISPHAVEILDGVDQDCDGYIDEGAIPEGALVVVELMIAPDGNDSDLEYFELYNTTGQDLVLGPGWVIRDEATHDPNLFRLDSKCSGLTLTPDPALFAVEYLEGTLSDSPKCVYDYEYLKLADTPGSTEETAYDQLAIFFEYVQDGALVRQLVDRVEWRKEDVRDSRSYYFADNPDDCLNNAGCNDDPVETWCRSSTEITDDDYQDSTGTLQTNYGTPGQPNDADECYGG